MVGSLNYDADGFSRLPACSQFKSAAAIKRRRCEACAILFFHLGTIAMRHPHGDGWYWDIPAEPRPIAGGNQFHQLAAGLPFVMQSAWGFVPLSPVMVTGQRKERW